MQAEKKIQLRAYGKINLSLDVLGRRPDGYHDIRSFMQDIDLCDDVTVAVKSEKTSNIGCFMDDIAVDFCIDKNTIPADMSNLALKGAKAVIDELVRCGTADEMPDGLAICVEKKLPVAAGLAGGSGNAAAVMLAVDHLLGDRLTLEELMRIGARVGADVPFSLMMNAAKNRDVLDGLSGLENAGTSAMVTGIGEQVEKAEPVRRHVILMNPGIAVSTKEVYDAIDRMSADRKGDRGLFYNIMEDYTLAQYSEAAALNAAMKCNMHADAVLMSGSGPTMAAYYCSREVAQSDFEALSSAEWFDHKWHAWCVESGGGK